MKLMLVPKRIHELMTHLKIDAIHMMTCTYEQLETMLDPIPTLDRKVLINFNHMYNELKSVAMVEIYQKYKVGDFKYLLREYFSNVDMNPRLAECTTARQTIQCATKEKLISEEKDYHKNACVLILDDSLIKLTLCEEMGNAFAATVISTLLYNEIISTGRTPVKLIHNLFKYI